MNIKNKINSLIIASLLVSSATPISGYTASAETSVQNYTHDFSMNVSSEQLNKEEKELIKLFNAIEEMPESVINQGSSAINNYIYIKTGVNYKSSKLMTEGSTLRSVSAMEVMGCASAIGSAIITNFTPAKILKVKAALKTVGGATTFVKHLIPYYKMARSDKMSRTAAIKLAVKLAAKDASPATREALLDLFGIGTVIATCGAMLEKQR